ncbi:hypothetical protein CES85_2443 [Ochrobactrum quorumnocens]|jgi:hypothetical protein|uniref:Uncharacterized protein n=1 Tax=Ochrobactrum quorumnocens TaxID=271865 RepID=A0A248UL81_9HYPH|nr:hypothetical protein CES85_2443 [[Ochrobactrum] quorumnocens]
MGSIPACAIEKASFNQILGCVDKARGIFGPKPSSSVLLSPTGGYIMAGLSLVKFRRSKNAGYPEITDKNSP